MSNQAAWITAVRARPFEIKEAPMPKPGPSEVVLKTHALAINPVEYKIQSYGIFLQKYPNILGCDAAGEVYEVGPDVTHVKKGDRVIAHLTGLLTNNPSHGAYQHYSLASSLLVQKIPSSMAYTTAVVLPLAISTASECLFNKKALGLSMPSPSLTPPQTGKSVLIWGGSSSVGAAAVQPAVAAGIKVVTVASKHNLEKVRALGAHAVFDYNSSTVTGDILEALKGTAYTGVADCIGSKESAAGWAPVFNELGGRYGSVMPDAPDIPQGAEGHCVFASLVASADRYVGEGVWGNFVTPALERGSLKPKPDPIVMGKGLETIQEAVDMLQQKSVSFGKIVVEL